VKDKIVKSIMITGGSSLLCQLVTWLSTIVVARILNPEDYGLLGMAAVYVYSTELINELGVGAAIVQRQDINDDDIRGIYTVAILVGIFITGVSYLIAPLISLFFNEQKLIPILEVLSITYVVSSARSVQRNLMVRDMAFADIAKVDVMCGILSSMLALICAVQGLRVWSLVVQYLSMNLMGLIGAFWYERRLPGRIVNWPKLKEMLSFGVGIMLSKSIINISRNVDGLIIGKMLGKSVLGNYSLAQTLANKPFEKILPILNQVFIPHFSKIQSDKALVITHFMRIISFELLIFTPIFVLITITSRDIIISILGSKWLDAVLPMQVFSMLSFCKYIEHRIALVLTSQGRARSQVNYSFVLTVIMTMSIYLFAVYYGIIGVLFAWALCYPIVLIIYFMYFVRLFDIKASQLISTFKMPVITSFIMSISVYLIVLLSIDNSIIRLISKIIIAILFYVGSNYIFNRCQFNEIFGMLIKKKQLITAL